MEAERIFARAEEQSSPAPQPMTMERTNSSEMGSDSSVSTESFTKDLATNSSRRSEVESGEDPASPKTPRSPSDRDEASRLLAPSLEKDNNEQKAAPDNGQKNDKGDSEKATTVKADSENRNALPKKATTVKADSENRNALPKEIARGFVKDQVKAEAKEGFSDKQRPGSGTGSGPWTGPTQDDESKYSDYTCPCSSCCQSCTAGGIIFNVLSCICFPLTIGQMAFTGVCCRCPRLIASVAKQTANRTKSRLSKGKPEQSTGTKFSREHFDLEEPEPEEGSTQPKSTKSDEIANDTKTNHGSSANVISKPSSESPSKPPGESTKDDEGDLIQDQKKVEMISELENRNLFFPSPEAADDRPGGDKPCGR